MYEPDDRKPKRDHGVIRRLKNDIITRVAVLGDAHLVRPETAILEYHPSLQTPFHEGPQRRFGKTMHILTGETRAAETGSGADHPECRCSRWGSKGYAFFQAGRGDQTEIGGEMP